MPKKRRIALENAKRLRTYFGERTYLRTWWGNARRFMVRFKPAFIKGKRGTYVIDIGVMTHEAQFGIRLAIAKDKSLVNLMVARLEPKGKIIQIKSIQGEPERDYWRPVGRTLLPALREFEQVTKTKAGNYLIQELKRQGKEMGYKSITLVKPEKLPNFAYPATTLAWQKRVDKLKEKYGGNIHKAIAEIKAKQQELMKKFYYGLAESEVFVDKGNYWELEL